LEGAATYENPQHFDRAATHPVGHPVPRLHDDQFACAGYSARATKPRLIRQHRHRGQHPLDHHTRSAGLVVCNVGGFVVEVLQRCAQPLNLHRPAISWSGVSTSGRTQADDFLACWSHR
jgi:hypothetical protein